MEKQHYSILFIIIGFLHISRGCTIEGIDNWLIPQTRRILDTYRGNLFSGATENVEAITNVIQREGLIAGPYVKVSLENSLFIISTDTAFENYENIETEMTLGYTITLRCTGGSLRTFVFNINITDTNNNDPVFLPSNKYEFTIVPPVPPGFLVTSCLNEILVRDIDLTTQSIDFKIEGSDLFDIGFDPSSQVAKEFKAILKTTNLIRSIPEPIRLTVTATDVDLTTDPPRSATASVIISADSQFQFPDEPIFSQPFYFATYKSDNDVILQNTISLIQGFDDEVKFTFESDHSEYFGLVVNKNNLSFNIKAPIPVSLYEERQIYLVVRASREHTSGTTATVVLKLPEDTPLEFENAIYEGTITDNVLQLIDLRLKQGYEGLNITVNVKSEYSFRAIIETNVIKISMDPLAGDVIKNNNFINLQIIASNNRTTAVAVVTLAIIKDDYITPVFENNLYSGSYSTALGITLEPIILSQGFDNTVKISLEGKYIEYFKTTQDGPKITLTSSTIPSDIFNERNIIITVVATKPRTVGAHATVNIALPEARYLDFENDIYEGSIDNNNLTLDTITMTDGYGSDINFTLTGEFMTYFSVKNDQNLVTINIVKEIPENVLSENDYLVLTLSASGTNTVPTSTSIVLQIIKEDLRTPMFGENLYSFKYENDDLRGNLTLIQGFDDTVTFELLGDHREYFVLEPSHNFIKLILKSSIPEDVIFNEKIIILNVVARKPRTVGANTAVYIKFPQEMIEPTVMSFTQNAYKGKLEGSVLTVDDIALETGYTNQTKFILSGEYSENFSITNSNEVVKITSASDWSIEDIENNNIILEVKATRERAIAANTIVVIDIYKSIIVPPVFKKAFYKGTFTSIEGLLFEESMSLEEGFDNTVEFSLNGEFSKWFILDQKDNSVNLKVNSTNPIPEAILENNLHLFFTIIASKPGKNTGRAVIYIDLPKEESTTSILQFENRQYMGIIENGTLQLENIRLSDGNISLVNFKLTGDLSKYFTITKLTNAIKIEYVQLPEEVIENTNFIILNVEASQSNSISGHTTIVLEIIKNEGQIIVPIFEEAIYTGQYSNSTGLVFSVTIKLLQGFDETVTFDIIDDDAEWFSLINNGPNNLSIRLKGEGLNEISGRTHLVFTVVANKTNSPSARSAVIISLTENNDFKILKFEQTSYVGRIEEQVLHIENIRLIEENILSKEFIITGDYASYFRISKSSDFIQIILIEAPPEMIEDNYFIVLNLEASQLGAISGHTTIVIKIVKDDEVNISKPIFSEIYYTGEYSQESELKFPTSITLVQGYDETVTFELEDEDSQWFSLVPNIPNDLTLKIKNDSISDIVGRGHLIFTVVAHKLNSTSARAAIVISLLENSNVKVLQFEKTSYLGNLDNKVLELENLRILDGMTSSTEFNIIGDYASHFSITKLSDSIKVSLIQPPTEQIENNDFIILNVKAFEPGAISGHTTIVLNVVKKPEYNTITPVFSEAYYSGQYSEENGLVFLSVITLIQGYDETVTFILDDDDSQGFVLKKNGLNNFSLMLNGSLSETENRNYLLFAVIAQKPDTNNGRAAIVISLTEPLEIDNVSFDRVLYNGKLHNGVLSHDTITLSSFNGTNIQIIGDYNDFFKSELKNDIVKVETTVSEFPRNLTYIALELKASSANAILLMDVSFSENPQLPIVSFKSPSYFLWADIQQTGRVGVAEATADNGEPIAYSLSDVNEQIQNRININNDGEILLTATFDKGIYRFNVVATSVQSQVQATAPVLLRVDTLPECSNEVGLSPLIILERLEEEPHLNLVVLNQTEHQGCQYTLSNVFPKDQSWLYVDNDGLHAKAIDREDKSIAFMTLSQIQVELSLDCDSDGVPALTKRSLGTEDRSDLYYYDDAPNKWVLTDSILFNARRSLVNLIVQDINDNSPIFLEKGNEPIYVGYPVSELEGTVLPRALVELKATDADIGENAAIIYWSEEDNLAVSPNTGLVHVRNKAKLENNSRLTIYAIDQNGKGRNGTIDVMVKLLDKNQIVVLTIRDAFLEDEVDVLNKLSVAVGYKIKVLRAVVISNNDEELTRKKRDVTNNSRASLQLYVYGLFESEPVDINQLTRDISNSNIATVNIARIISLEDHLEGIEIRPPLERDIGLFASTIALGVLLFIIIVAIAVWFFLKWRRSKNYEQFSNRTSTVSELASPNIPKIEVVSKPRPDIDEIKRTERRLQEMLDTPVENSLVQIDDDVKPPIETYDEAIINISSADAQLPIVIQSIDKLKDNTDDSDDNDEFGEIQKPRKSIVTFNENVEKIIHIEDVPDDEESSDNSYEIYKF